MLSPISGQTPRRSCFYLVLICIKEVSPGVSDMVQEPDGEQKHDRQMLTA